MGIVDQNMPAPVTFKLIGLDGKPIEVTAEQLNEMDHATLYTLRARNNDDKAAQNLLAPIEHKAFAREATADNPLMSVPIALATPLYAGAKMLGLQKARTDPSFEEVKQGLIGVGQGLYDAATGAKPR